MVWGFYLDGYSLVVALFGKKSRIFLFLLVLQLLRRLWLLGRSSSYPSGHASRSPTPPATPLCVRLKCQQCN